MYNLCVVVSDSAVPRWWWYSTMDKTYKMDFDADQSLKEWAKDKPLSILQLDPADRAVLRIAG